MIRGLFISQDGEIQQIGELTTLSGIIQAMQGILPDLQQQEKQRLLSLWSSEEIEKAASDIKNKRAGK